MLESSAAFSVAFYVDIQYPDPYRLRLTSKLDNIEFGGQTFFGGGTLGNVSMPSQDGELSPSDYSITLSGVSDEILEACTQPEYLNYVVIAYIQYMDEYGNDIAEPQNLWQGLTDGCEVDIGIESNVLLRVRDRMTDWNRAKLESYTDGDQERLHPGDKGFEFISQLADKDVAWPEGAYFSKAAQPVYTGFKNGGRA
jgi:hypothetical protein